MPTRRPLDLSRRTFLVGGTALAGAVVLGACGDSGSGDGEAAPTTVAGGLALAQFFGGLPMLAAGSEVRAPFGMADADGLLPVDQTPTELTMRIAGPDGGDLGDPVVVSRYAAGLPRAYFPLRFTADRPGVYTARTEVNGEALEMAMKVDPAADVSVIQIGAALPDLTTPTAADPKGVNPICTNDPVCPLHDTTVGAVLDEGRPLALLVATPAFCQVAICGPVLDVLLSALDSHPDVHFLHAEVFKDPERDLEVSAPIVGELGLTFEPCLVLVDRSGRVVERLDTIYDERELDEALVRLV